MIKAVGTPFRQALLAFASSSLQAEAHSGAAGKIRAVLTESVELRTAGVKVASNHCISLSRESKVCKHDSAMRTLTGCPPAACYSLTSTCTHVHYFCLLCEAALAASTCAHI